MAISLEKQIADVTLAKKRYQSFFWLAAGLLALLLAIIYYNSVLDFAVIDNVKIERQPDTNTVVFQYDVIKPGRIDFRFGNNAILSDRQEAHTGEKFQWAWGVSGETVVSIRSRKLVVPHWDNEQFTF